MKTFNDFQKFCCDTWFGPKDEFTIAALGVAGEAGEVADKVKKILRGDKDIPVLEVVKEIGDVLFYCAILCDRFGYTLQEAALMEMEKINSRIERGTRRGSGDNR